MGNTNTDIHYLLVTHLENIQKYADKLETKQKITKEQNKLILSAKGADSAYIALKNQIEDNLTKEDFMNLKKNGFALTSKCSRNAGGDNNICLSWSAHQYHFVH